MIFEGLSEKLQNTFNKLKNRGKLNENDIKLAMREIKLALLEADVNFKVVKSFVKNVSEKATGKEILESLTPGQQVIKLVRDEMIELLGKDSKDVKFEGSIGIIMMCGLQGSGKTTTSGKLAQFFKKKGKRPLLVACDVYRPAAVEQLKIVGSKVDIPVFEMGTKEKPVKIVKEALAFAKKNGNDLVIIDTAGRLHIDETLMNELKEIKNVAKIDETLLVVDSMTGQDAVTVSDGFNNELGIDGVILTKLDGDTRGGAALSVRAVTQKPIKFIGTGEKLDEFEVFYPDRIVSRILGMGDILTFIDKAQEAFDEKKALELEKKMRDQSFTFEDYLDQLEQLKNMGPLNKMFDMIPGMNAKAMKGMNVDEKKLVHVEAIIKSMTREERMKPQIINASRRKRIAKGSGTSVQKVNEVLKQFTMMKKMMKNFNPKKLKGLGGMKMPFLG